MIDNAHPMAEPARLPLPQPGGVKAPRVLDSASVLGPRGEVWIRHGEQLYRLRVTSLGKLILTK